LAVSWSGAAHAVISLHPNGVLPLPKHRTFRLITPTQHEIHITATPIDLEFKVHVLDPRSGCITGLDANKEIIHVGWSFLLLNRDYGVLIRLAAKISRVGNHNR
jgi:hypothetical protein